MLQSIQLLLPAQSHMIKYLLGLLLLCTQVQAQYYHQIPNCFGDNRPVRYSVPYSSQFNYNYQVINGNIINQNNGDILIDWNLSAGSGQLIVTVTNDLNCGSSVNLIMETLPCNTTTIYVPNSFTPNSDGYNDVFTAKATNIKYYEMTIYNRWGQQLYFTRNINGGWNGKVRGRLSPRGVYSYKIRYQDYQNYYKELVGKVSLIR
jgi:gliding motility-associated-like protein